MGRGRRQDLGLWGTQPIAHLLCRPDAGSERDHPVVRDPVAIGIRGHRGTPLSDAVTLAPVRVPIGVAVARTADTDAGRDADTDAGTDPDTLADAGPDPDPDTHTLALRSSAPGGRGSASIPA